MRQYGVRTVHEVVSGEGRILCKDLMEELGLKEGVGFRGAGNRVVEPAVTSRKGGLRQGQVFVDAVPLSPEFFRKFPHLDY